MPLTCSRAGTCCHGNLVLLNPWEIYSLASEKKISPKEFRDQYTEFGGTKLLFNGSSSFKGKKSCTLYVENFGCSVHLGRPLACRLFPLGRQIQNNETTYIFEGKTFPCLKDCPDVTLLPKLSVATYLKGQATDKFESAQDAYLELMQNLADIAFELLLDTGLAQSGDTKTLPLWKIMGNEEPEMLANRIGKDWLDILMVPEISDNCSDPISFVHEHNELLQIKIEAVLPTLKSNEALHQTCVLMMALALHLARAIGANPASLAMHWCETAEGYL
ncbi:MAG: YkgJ family cysteine cluster protein [Crocinitomicaceae bacterium]|nr:YkgJ family cysteine cluster protein [Crocinitomicaceae bacterium]